MVVLGIAYNLWWHVFEVVNITSSYICEDNV